MRSIIGAVKRNVMTSARSFSNYPVKNCGDYLIRHATSEEYRSIVELRAEHLWEKPIQEASLIEVDHDDLVELSKEDNFHCIVAVSNKAEPTIKDSIYGALTLKVEINVPQEYTFLINDNKWISDEEKDAHVCDLVVTPRLQRRQIGTNLLLYAKEIALMRNMDRLMAYTDKEHVVKLNKKVGFQVIPTELTNETVMGLHLPKVEKEKTAGGSW